MTNELVTNFGHKARKTLHDHKGGGQHVSGYTFNLYSSLKD